MAFSKIVLNGVTQIDLTQDTVAASNLLTGETAHGADGQPVVGAASGGGGGVQSGTFTPTERTSSVSFDCGLTSINVLLIVPLNESPLKSGGKTFVGGYYSSDLYYKYFLGTSNNAGSGMQAPQNGTDGQPYELNGTTVTVYSSKTVPSVNAGSFETITYKWYAW